MASYSGRFISNLKKDQYNVSDSGGCGSIPGKYTYDQIRKHNKKDDCLVSVNGIVYDIDSYKESIKTQNDNPNVPEEEKLDKIFLDLKCGKNYKILKEKDFFKIKNLRNSYNENWGYLKNLMYTFKQRYLLNNTQEEKERLKLLNLEDLQRELHKKDIKYFDKENPNEDDLRDRLLHNYKIRKNNKIYVLIAKLMIVTGLLVIYFITKKSFVLYILISLIIYEFYINIKYLLIDINYDRECVNVGSHINTNYSDHAIGTIANYNQYKFLFNAILLLCIIFLCYYYYRTRNHYIILTVFLIIIYNFISNYKLYKIKNEVVNDIKERIEDVEDE